MLFTCTLQSDVLSRDTTCRGIGHLVCASSRVPSPLPHRLQSQAKTALAVMLFTCPLQSDVLSRDTTCRGIGHLVCVCSRSSIPFVSPTAEPSENCTSNLTFAVTLFTCTLQSHVLSRDTTCRGIGHLLCASSRVPSPLSHRPQSQAKTALRTSHLQSRCSLAHYSQTFLAVTPPAVPVHEFHPLCLTDCRAKRKPHFEPHICSHVVHLHTTVRRS